MNYKEARAICTEPGYKGIKKPGGYRHPRDLELPRPVGNWGADFSVALFYEKQLHHYIYQNWGVCPDFPWTVDMSESRGIE